MVQMNLESKLLLMNTFTIATSYFNLIKNGID